MPMPTKYVASHPERAYRLALLGLTNPDIESAFGIDHHTFQDWRARYPEFEASLQAGKIEADANVAHALYRRAIGWTHPESRLFVVDGKILKRRVIVHYPPDSNAAAKWLHNRRPDLWRPVKEPEAANDEAPPPTKVTLQVVDGRKRAEPQQAAG